jgi:predicted AlkP superfamily pyrophosphatase or phosphodiesterase
MSIIRAALAALLSVLLLGVIDSRAANFNHHVVLITMDGFPAYLMSDPQAPIPTLRQLARDGALAEGLHVSNPSVTWPNHTTLVTGVGPDVHSVLFNGVLVRGAAGVPARIDPRRDKADLVAAPTVYDVLGKGGLRTAAVNWPCTRNSGSLDFDFPDVPEQVTHTTSSLRDELVVAGILPDATQQAFQRLSSAAKDQIWTASAVHITKKHKPNLLLFHMLITDSTHHKYGAQSPAGYTAVALADSQLRDVLDALEVAGIKDRTTVFVVSDHGFEKALKLMNPNVLLRKAGLLESGPNGAVAKARAHIISEGGTAMVYLTDPATRDEDAIKVRSILAEAEGIQEILGPEQFPAFGYPDPGKNQQMADLVLAAKEGYAFVNNAEGEDFITPVTLTTGNQGHHGYLSNNPKMNAVFVASGRGIKAGAKTGVLENTRVAPTIAHLLGIKLDKSSATPLTEILAP